MHNDRLLASILATFGAVSAIPLALAQLDFAGVVNIFRIDHGDVANGLLVLAAVGGALTCCVIAAALLGAALCLTGSDAARPILLTVAVAGFATALPLWLPSAIAIGAAAFVLNRTHTADAAPRTA